MVYVALLLGNLRRRTGSAKRHRYLSLLGRSSTVFVADALAICAAEPIIEYYVSKSRWRLRGGG